MHASALTRSIARGLSVLAVLALAPGAAAQERWKTPPEDVVRILEASPAPHAILDPTRSTLLLVERTALPPLSDLAAPMVPLAGLRVNPATRGTHGVRRASGLSLVRIADGRVTKVELPGDMDLGAPSFSPDGRRFAFTRTTRAGIELWLGETGSGRARAVTPPSLHAVLGTPYRWVGAGARILVRLAPEGAGPAPERPLVPPGPDAQETAGKKAPARTFTDLLRDAHDDALLEHYTFARLGVVDVEAGRLSPVMFAPTGLIRRFDPSPDGSHVLVSLIVRPFSRLVPLDLFPEVVLAYPFDGARMGEPKEIARVALREEIPIQGVETGPRAIDWCDSEPAEVTWVEAIDGGDPRAKVAHRDRVLARRAPFEEMAREVLRTEHRLTNLTWLETKGGMLVTEVDRDRRWTRTWLHNAGEAPRVIFDRSVQDRYGAPGSPLQTRNVYGRSVVRVRDGAIYLAGQGASPSGARPFLDRMRLDTGAKERLYRSPGGGWLDTVVDVLDAGAERILVTRETPTTPPNYLVLTRTGGPVAPPDLAATPAESARYEAAGAPLTAIADPAAALRKHPPRLLTYARPDGVTLSARLYAPPSWTPGGPRVPLLVWAYPLEFSDGRTAGQVSGSPLDYAPIGGLSHLVLLSQGYAILDGATMPVIGDPETVNDTFVEQITAAARAAIAVAVREGVADPERCAVGGHSYGAFMTANLLAHTDLFRAGIARSGAYNRTLTPFGFQGERRSFWEAPETYARMSPFTFAHRIDEPLLLVHGRWDQNTGTFPLQSERLFHAIQGTGGTARLVMLPYENHGYAARESVLTTHAETIEWLDRHVKNASPREGVIR